MTKNELDMTAPGEKLLLRVWDTLEKCGTGLLSPWRISREGRARTEVRRHEVLLDAQTAKDVEEIRAGRAIVAANGEILRLTSSDADKRIEPQPPSLTYERSALNDTLVVRERAAATDRLLNLRSVARLAETEALEHQGVNANSEVNDSDSSPSREWIRHWEDGAEGAFDEEVRHIWARLIVKEVSQPGLFSVRTLQALRTFTRADAELFSRVAPFVIVREFLYNDLDMLSEFGVPFSDLLHLQGMGLLLNANSKTVRHAFNMIVSEEGRYYCGMTVGDNRGLVVETPAGSAKREFLLDIISLTNVAKEILHLGDFPANEAFVQRLAQRIHAMGYKTSTADAKVTSNGSFTLTNVVWVSEGRSPPIT